MVESPDLIQGPPRRGPVHCSDDDRPCLIAVGCAAPMEEESRIDCSAGGSVGGAALSVYPMCGYQPCYAWVAIEPRGRPSASRKIFSSAFQCQNAVRGIWRVETEVDAPSGWASWLEPGTGRVLDGWTQAAISRFCMGR